MPGVKNGCSGRRRLSPVSHAVTAQSMKPRKLRLNVLTSCLGVSSSTSASVAVKSSSFDSATVAATRKLTEPGRPRLATPRYPHRYTVDRRSAMIRDRSTGFRSQDSTPPLTSDLVSEYGESLRRQSAPIALEDLGGRVDNNRIFRHHLNETFVDNTSTADSLEASGERQSERRSRQMQHNTNDEVIIFRRRSSISIISTASCSRSSVECRVKLRSLDADAATTFVATKTEVECDMRRVSDTTSSTSFRERRRRLDASNSGSGAGQSASIWWPNTTYGCGVTSALADSGYAGATTVLSVDRTDACSSKDWNETQSQQLRGSRIRNCTRLGQVTEECGDMAAIEVDESRLVNRTGMGLSSISWTEDVSVGHVRLSVSIRSDSSVRVSVQKTRNLRAPAMTQTIATFIQIDVFPTNPSSCSRCTGAKERLRRAEIDNKGMLREKFEIDLDNRDVNSRLEISCWIRHDGEPEVSVGCMSFDVSRLLRNTREKRSISGWYHLLPQSIGKLKHIRVARTAHANESNKENGDRMRQPTSRNDVIVPRLECPSYLSTPVSSNCRIVDSDQNYNSDGRSEKATVPMGTGNRKRRLLNTIFGCSPATGIETDRPSLVSKTTRSLTHLQQGKYYKWNPDISVISAAVSSASETSQPQRRSIVIEHNGDVDDNERKSVSCGTSMMDFFEGDDSSDETNQSWKRNGFIETNHDREGDSAVTESSMPGETFCTSTTDRELAADALASRTSENPSYQEDRLQAVRHLVAVETAFAADMAIGIQRYSRPLRCYRAMSSSQHTSLFQNVEKLVCLSDYHVGLLTSSSAADVGETYLPRIAVLSEAYTDYLVGLDSAHRTLQRMKQDPEFIGFLQNNEDDRSTDKIASLQTFLDRPAIHVVRLFHQIYDVLAATPDDHRDYWQLKCTAENMLRLCSKSQPL